MKQQFHTTLFPEGLVYDSKNNNYRTPKVNEVIALIANESRSLENKKSRTSEKISKKSGLVPCGLDLSNFIDDFQGLRILMNSRNWKSVF